MKKSSLISVAVTAFLALIVLVPTVNAGSGSIKGTGSEEDPYIIEDAEDWNVFAANAAAGSYGAGKHFSLVNSIGEDSAVTVMAGSNDHPFNGVFHGNGNTLTVDINNSVSLHGAAPFQNIKDAVIDGLVVKGTVRSGDKHPAGLVGISSSGSTGNKISNCTVYTSVTGNTYIGGVVGHGTSSNLTLENVAFKGKLNFTDAKSFAGGLVGWNDGATLTFKNCLYAGTAANGTAAFHPVSIKYPLAEATASAENIYCTADHNTGGDYLIPGTDYTVVSASAPVNSIYREVKACDDSTYYVTATVSGIDSFYLNTEEEIEIVPVVKEGETLLKEGTDYIVSTDPFPVKARGSYSITVSGTGSYKGKNKTDFKVGDKFRYRMYADSNVYIVDCENDVANVLIPDRVPLDYIVQDLAGRPVYGIAQEVFENNQKIETLTAGDNLVEIGPYAFSGCSNLKTVTIGSGLKTLAHSSFNGTVNLKEFTTTMNNEIDEDFDPGFTSADTVFKGLHGSTFASWVKDVQKGKFFGIDRHSEPTWIWSSDGSSATADFDCDTPCIFEKKGVKATVTSAPGSEAGTVVYTAKVTVDGYEYTDTKTVKVVLKLDKSSTPVVCGDTASLKATLTGSKDKISWKSSDTKIATVDANGKVTTKMAGTVTITASAVGIKAACTVTVLYKDVTNTSDFWYAPTNYLTKNGIVKGYDNQTLFKPANECTRAQMITFLWRLAGQPNPKKTTTDFKDIKTTDYFYKPVLWAVENGITTGYSKTEFGPQLRCTRKQAVTFLWRMAGKPEPGKNAKKFSDVRKTDYFYKAALWASDKKILAGYSDGSFKPDGLCLRRQMVTFLYKYDKYVNGKG